MGYRILIADDEAEIRDLLRLYLEKDGYEVLEAADGLETMESVKRENPDLLLPESACRFQCLLQYCICYDTCRRCLSFSYGCPFHYFIQGRLLLLPLLPVLNLL